MGTLRLGSSVIVPSVMLGESEPPVIDSLSITPTTSQQTITAPSGVDGYSPITVDAVDNTIDSNITANNIKSGVTILGVTGNIVELNGETKTVIPQTYGQTIYPTNPKNGITEITVNPVTSSIDANITAGNIKKDVSILGVTGTYEGIQPSGSLSITQNGTYDVTNYASASVNVSGGGGYSELPSYQVTNGVASRRAKVLNGTEFSNITAIGDYGMYMCYYRCLNNLSGPVDLSNVTSIGEYGLQEAFENTAITSVDLSSLVTTNNKTCALQNAFASTNITVIDMSLLTTITGLSVMSGICTNCLQLTSVDLSNVTIIGSSGLSNGFYGDTALVSALLSSLTTIDQSGMYATFYNTGLTTFTFDVLNSLGYYALNYCFAQCRNLATLYFPALKSTSFPTISDPSEEPLYDMLYNTSNVTVHFPSNLQSVIGTWSSVQNGFGGTNTTVLFDLPATE